MYDLLAMEEIDSESGNHQGKQKKGKIFSKRAERAWLVFALTCMDMISHGMV